MKSKTIKGPNKKTGKFLGTGTITAPVASQGCQLFKFQLLPSLITGSQDGQEVIFWSSTV